jgi:tRNA nucleotidyltransferase/poly(A) polymerase
VERIRDELFQLLEAPAAAEALAECWAFGMARWLVGEEQNAASPAERVRALSLLLDDGLPELRRLADERPTPPRGRRELLLWAGALCAAGADPGAAARHLALSNDERQIIVKAVGNAEPVRALVRRWPTAGRVRYRTLRAAGGAGPEAVLLAAAADGWSQAYAELLAEALQRHYWPEPPLLSGLEVMQILDVCPGPQVGAALEAVEEARADGLLRTPGDAVQWLRERRASLVG